jgi:hypothetical protein
MDTLEQVFVSEWSVDRVSRLVSEEAIRERAYEIYEWRGKQHGRSEENWFAPEMKLRNGGLGVTIPNLDFARS